MFILFCYYSLILTNANLWSGPIFLTCVIDLFFGNFRLKLFGI